EESMKVADALMTLGSFVGIVRLTDAVDAASVPVSDAEAELVGPTRPTAVTVTGVPGGTLDAATATVTGFVVLAGNVMSGLENEALGVAGVVTPATEVIRSTGPAESTTGPGAPSDGTAPKLIAAELLKASIRMRP